MMGRESKQKSFYDADYICSVIVPRDSFYHTLHVIGPSLINDDDFAEMYCDDNGRPSVPPSILAKTLLLQEHDNVSDRKAAENVKLNIGWKHALQLPLNYEGFAYSLLSIFRARLIVHELENKPFEKLNKLAKELGIIDEKHVHALDSSSIIGHAQLQDTYTLIQSAITKTVNSLHDSDYKKAIKSLIKSGLLKYNDYQKPEIDWDYEKENREYLKQLVQDANELLNIISSNKAYEKEQIFKDSELLRKILQQDITYKNNDDNSDVNNKNNNSKNSSPDIKQGVAKDRIISTVDPEMRHGRKSSSQKFNGYKAHIVEDLESEWITNVEVDYANKRDSEIGPVVITNQKKSTNYIPQKVLADNGYATSDGRADFAEESIDLISPVKTKSNNGLYNKYDFDIDLNNMITTCPAGNTTDKVYKGRDNKGREIEIFLFTQCNDGDCSHKAKCTTSKRGRTITLVYHEKEILKALERQKEKDFKETYKLRYKVERKISELFFLHGMRQARFHGRRLVNFQLVWKSVVINLKRLIKLVDKIPELDIKLVLDMLKTKNDKYGLNILTA